MTSEREGFAFSLKSSFADHCATLNLSGNEALCAHQGVQEQLLNFLCPLEEENFMRKKRSQVVQPINISHDHDGEGGDNASFDPSTSVVFVSRTDQGIIELRSRSLRRERGVDG